jgi:polyhydroxyalkanoate synthesis repressor PhaR
MSSDPIRIRRYPNRRLYDRSRRCYVTLQDIEEMVREGHTVQVQDSRTNEDITRQILTQLLLERHPEKIGMFPVAMLHGLLQTNELVVEFWRGYLRQAMGMLQGLQQPTGAAGGGVPGPLNWMSAFFPGWMPAPGGGSAGDGATAERLAGLEERLRKLEGEDGATAAERSKGSNLDSIEGRVRNLERRGRKG